MEVLTLMSAAVPSGELVPRLWYCACSLTDPAYRVTELPRGAAAIFFIILID